MSKHLAGPFTVRISCYSLETEEIGRECGEVYSARHASPFAAARKLASIIRGKSELVREIKRCIPLGRAGRYVIESGDGTKRALIPHRQAFCVKR